MGPGFFVTVGGGAGVYSLGMYAVAQAPCGKCGAPVQFHMAPRPVITNLTTVAIVALEHGGPVRCNACQAVLLPQVAKISAAITLAVQEEPPQVVLASAVPPIQTH